MTPSLNPREWHYVYGAVVLVTAAFFLFSVQAVLSPLFGYILLLLLLAPYAGTTRHTTLLIVATLALLLWLLEALGSMLAPFLLAFVLAYILDPAVDAVQRWRQLQRGPAVAVVVAPALLLLALALGFGIPALIQQIENLVQRVPSAAENVAAWLERLRDGQSRVRIPFVSNDVLQRWLDPDRIAELIEAQQNAIAARAWDVATGVRHGVGILLSIVSYLVLVPVLLIYLLRDFDRITERTAALVPDARRARWISFMKEYDALLSRFLRGQVIAATIVGVLTWLGLWLLGVPYAGLVGVIAGVFNLVPYLGLVVSIIPVVIIALLTGSFLATLLRAGIVFAIVQLIDGTITGPRIVGSSVGLHPVWVILALAVGGAFFGFVGLLIAMPAAVLIKLLLREGVARYRRSAVFLGTTAP
ncbi:MAG TPA: AI-2E family transporter [Longimicrobiales bacterium]|nr:AI-2E family transporter [Longimicrobiales bacterium]